MVAKCTPSAEVGVDAFAPEPVEEPEADADTVDTEADESAD